MYGKILIQCDLIVRTGMHIGASGAFSAIGAVDSPVVRDTLKGKLRTLLARSFSGDIEHMPDFKNDEAPILRCSEVLTRSERRGSSLPIALSIIKSR